MTREMAGEMAGAFLLLVTGMQTIILIWIFFLPNHGADFILHPAIVALTVLSIPVGIYCALRLMRSTR